MDILKLEYLIKLDGNKSLCNNIDTFENLLQISSNIKLKGNIIEYKNIEINYNNKKYINEDRENVFDLEVYISNNENISKFEEFLRELKDILHKISNNILVLQDDISLYYSVKAYPIFNEVENLMRKLLTKFMVIKVGDKWDEDNIPKKVKKSIESSKRKDSYSLLYRADFSDLSKFLFDKYSNKTLQDLSKELSNGKEIDKENYIEKSNWERYFSNIVKYEDSELKKQWEHMYELRCKIAHNNKFTKEDNNRLLKIYDKIKPRLIEAIDNIDSIVIDIEERKVFTENIISNADYILGKFIKKFNELDEKFVEVYAPDSINREGKYKDNIFRLIKTVKSKHPVEENLMDDIKDVMKIRNEVLHGVRSVNDADLNIEIEEIEKIITILNIIKKSKFNENNNI